VRLRPERRNHVWSYDFVSASTHDGRSLRMLNLIDEYTRENLAIRVDRRLNSHDVIDTLAEAAAALVARLPSAGAGRGGKSRAHFIGKCGDLD
jgi:hypothetical protein